MDEEFEGFEGELDDDYDISTPEHAGATLRRFLKTASDQWVRLAIVTLSIVCYTVLTVYAPFRSAGVVDLLWNQIQAANAAGGRFSITWADGGRDISRCCSSTSAWARSTSYRAFSWRALPRTSATACAAPSPTN